jgi:hypothetical protein
MKSARMLNHIAHGGTIYLQNGSINVLAMLSDASDVYDTRINKARLISFRSLIQHQKLTAYQKIQIRRV